MQKGFCVRPCSSGRADVWQVALQHHILLQVHILLIEWCAQPHAWHQAWAHDHTLIKALLKQPTSLYHVARVIILHGGCLEGPTDVQTHACAIAEMLSWPTDATVPPALSAQLHCLAEPALLKAVVQQALPVQSSAPPVDSIQHASTVRSLCNMLQGITNIPALCQKALIFTAGPADFVQRLWSSYLKVNHHLLPPCSLPCFYNAYVQGTQAIN